MAKNKLEKFNVGKAIVHVNFNAFHGFDHPSIDLVEPGENGWSIVRVEFQRHELSLNKPGMNDWERHRAVIEAQATGGTAMDVGEVPYGPCYAPKMEVRLEKLERVASLLAAIGRTKAESHHCELRSMLAALRELNVPIQWQYHGRNVTYDFAYEVPESCSNKASKLAFSPEAQEVLARHYQQEAERLRAATAATATEAA